MPYSDFELNHLPIETAASREAGGNGLATREFAPHDNFGLRWQRASTHEAIIVNGVLQEQKGEKLEFDPKSLIGMKPRMQRIMLRPPILDNIEAEGRTSDGYKTKLTVSLDYVVKYPLNVAKERDALGSLKNCVKKEITEYISKRYQHEILHNPQDIHKTLEENLNANRVVSELYEIVAVTLQQGQTDERRTEAVTQQELENIKFAHEYKRMRTVMEVEEVIRTADHVRDMEKIEITGKIGVHKEAATGSAVFRPEVLNEIVSQPRLRISGSKPMLPDPSGTPKVKSETLPPANKLRINNGKTTNETPKGDRTSGGSNGDAVVTENPWNNP